MGDISKDLEPVKDIKKKLVDILKAEIDGKGIQEVDADEAGKVVDMIKDLAETEKACYAAKKDCYEAAYYKSVICAMEEWDDSDNEEIPDIAEEILRMGYPRGRGSNGGSNRSGSSYSSNGGSGNRSRNSMGRFTSNSGSSGSGSSYSGGRSGYRPSMMPDPADYRMWELGGAPSRGNYDDYMEARRNYTETRSQSDKSQMDKAAERHVRESVESIKDIWGDADPEMRRKIKSDLSKLVNNLDV